MSGWQAIETAMRDGTTILGRRIYADKYTGKLKYERHKTRWSKASHIPLYGWTYCKNRDVEQCEIWHPEHWKRLPETPTRRPNNA